MSPELLVSVGALVVGIIVVILLITRTGNSASTSTSMQHLEQRLEELGRQIQLQGHQMRQENLDRFRENRSELSGALGQMRKEASMQSSQNSIQQRELVEDVMEHISYLRSTLQAAMSESRNEQTEVLQDFERELTRIGTDMRLEQEKSRTVQQEQLDRLRAENSASLERIQQTVDEKLEMTLENRFNSSFQLISDRLEQVHRGLGEMRELAAGVGDLKRILSGVKTRGTLGEIQLGVILEQSLAPGQYEKNVHVVPGSSNVVEFAIRLPGRNDAQQVWLPVDSKFPLESYERLQDCEEAGDKPGARAAAKQLEIQIRSFAEDIHQKYIQPPYTTDFGVLFVPTEGLYAEIIKRPGLFESLQRQNSVTVVGPSTLTAFLGSLQMGFRTLAIERRSSEVWTLLGTVKSEFVDFGVAMEKVRKKLQETTNAVEKVGVRTRVMERKLRGVEALSPENDDEELPSEE